MLEMISNYLFGRTTATILIDLTSCDKKKQYDWNDPTNEIDFGKQIAKLLKSLLNSVEKSAY